jgi:hypothetical protein
MKNSMLSLLFGVLIGGILVYFLKPTDGGGNFTPIKVSAPTPALEAKNMILNLYETLAKAKDNDEITALFRRSYGINANDVRSILDANTGVDTIRIYPALKEYEGKNMLTFILMLQDGKTNEMLWDYNISNPEKQDLIQDQWGPCPKNCPTKELISEVEWGKINETYPSKFPNIKMP